MVIGNWCLVFPLSPNAQCPMPYAQCPMPNAQCPMPYAPCPMPHIKHKLIQLTICPRMCILVEDY
ncbi:MULTISPECIES: hypothetical protein [unclassified Tolypothrix]|uniref:hypothetical protein n=1 Tax=unclassified Tolypothrix TaxID=2649714 RepID=UPI0012D807E0|nr:MULTISPECIES: hypothetical protein [unclassified Tolypothrix]UYD35299.1 hypothetical protein HG267_05780 [Tolypothrix sp. PCC 7601]